MAMCCCPAHPDRDTSLSIRQGDRSLLVTCFAGCAHDGVSRNVGRIKPKLCVSNAQAAPFVRSIAVMGVPPRSGFAFCPVTMAGIGFMVLRVFPQVRRGPGLQHRSPAPRLPRLLPKCLPLQRGDRQGHRQPRPRSIRTTASDTAARPSAGPISAPAKRCPSFTSAPVIYVTPILTSPSR